MLCFLIAFVRLLWLRKMPMACFTASNSHFDHGGSDASDMTTWSAICLSGCRSVRVGWRCFALLIRADAASLCARSRGEPSSAHCEQRLSERLTPCPCDPVCACTGMRGHAEKGKGWLAKRLAKRCSRGAKATPHFCLRTHTQRSEPCRDGGVGWGGWGPIWRAQGV